MQNFATTYSIAMAVMALLLAAGLAAVGWNRYTPRTRKPFTETQLANIRQYCRWGAPALALLALLYLMSAP
jgi:uncharacterized membrane protein YqjE